MRKLMPTTTKLWFYEDSYECTNNLKIIELKKKKMVGGSRPEVRLHRKFMSLYFDCFTKSIEYIRGPRPKN